MRFTLSPKKRMCINCMSQHSVTMYFVYTAQYIGVRVWSRQSFCIIHCLFILFRCCFYYFVAIAVAVIDAGFFSFLLCFVLFCFWCHQCIVWYEQHRYICSVDRCSPSQYMFMNIRRAKRIIFPHWSFRTHSTIYCSINDLLVVGFHFKANQMESIAFH